MSNTTARTARNTRKSATTPAPTPAASVADVQASLDTTVTVADQIAARATDAADKATDTPTPAYTIPTGWDTDLAAYVATVGDAYRSADKAGKATIRKAWAGFQSDALRDLDMDRLAVVRDVNAVLVTARPVTESDPADAYLVHHLALTYAASQVATAFRDEHGDEAADALAARINTLSPDDEVWESIRTLATKLTVVKSGSRRTGPQRSVEAHIRSAIDAATKGTILTCAMVHNHRSDAYGPDDAPSVGAVGAAWGREMDGIESVTNDAKVKGFRAQA